MDPQPAKSMESEWSTVSKVNTMIAMGAAAFTGALLFLARDPERAAEREHTARAEAEILDGIVNIDGNDRLAVSTTNDIIILRTNRAGRIRTTPEADLHREVEQHHELATTPRNLVWIDDRLLVFTRNHDNPRTGLAYLEKLNTVENWAVSSCLVQILDTETKTITTLIDPYLPPDALSAQFGDISKADQRTVAELAWDRERRFAVQEGGSKRTDGSDVVEADIRAGKFYVQDVGIMTGNRDLIFLQVQDIWYQFTLDGNKLDRISSLPSNVVTRQLSSPASPIYLKEDDAEFTRKNDREIWRYTRIHALKRGLPPVNEVELISGGSSAAWFHKPE